MRAIPWMYALAGAAVLTCGGSEDSVPPPARPGDPPTTIPLVERDLAALFSGGTEFVSGTGDTMIYGVETLDEGDRLRLWRVRRSAAGTDSVAAVVDAASGAPVESWQRRLGPGGTRVAASVTYGAGFEGQARLILASPEGRSEDNLRTPVPLLDAAQIPQILARLDLSVPDTVSFNYVAPFERRAMAARVVVGPTSPVPGGDGAPAVPVQVEVGGLEERYWFSAPPDEPRLLRVEEPTRNVVWTPVAAAR